MATSSTTYEEGQSGNTNGRPQSEASRLRSEMRDAFCLKTYPKFNEIVDGIHTLALEDKDLNAYKIILDYCLGRPVQMKEEDEDKDKALNVRDVVLLNLIFDLFSPFVPSNEMEKVREKFNALMFNASHQS